LLFYRYHPFNGTTQLRYLDLNTNATGLATAAWPFTYKAVPATGSIAVNYDSLYGLLQVYDRTSRYTWASTPTAQAAFASAATGVTDVSGPSIYMTTVTDVQVWRQVSVTGGSTQLARTGRLSVYALGTPAQTYTEYQNDPPPLPVDFKVSRNVGAVA